MPATPGVSVDVTLSPAIGLVSSETWNPPVGIEAGRTEEEPTTPTVEGASGSDTIALSTKKK